jgi:RNA polymerase sigma factor (sigma-70 family)
MRSGGERFFAIGEGGVRLEAMAQPSPDTLLEPKVLGTLGEPSDAVLIERSLRHPERFEKVFDRHFAAIHGYIARRLGSGLADDVASETFLIAFDRRARYEPAEPDAAPWLYGIASNLIARHRRAEVRRYRALARAGGEHTVEGHSAGVARRLDAQALRARLASALLDLAARDREVLLLVAWAQLTLEETARALGIPAGTARSRLHRARVKTRLALADDTKGRS